MAKTYHSSNRWALTGLFKRINLGDDPKQLCSEAGHLVDKVDSNDIAAAQQTLIDEGYTPDMVEKISAAFVLMGLARKKNEISKSKLVDNHILSIMAAEHSMTRCRLEDLRQITDEIMQTDTITNVSSEFRRLSNLVEYFGRFKRHIEREEDIIFPYLNKYGWKGLSQSDVEDHKIILRDIDNLSALILSFGMLKIEEFKGHLNKISDHLISVLTDHMSYEEDLLWPIALIVIDEPKTWETVKALSDEFEYFV